MYPRHFYNKNGEIKKNVKTRCL